MDSRKEMLKKWEDILDKSSEMLRLVAKQNTLLIKSSKKEKLFRNQQAAYEKMIEEIEEFKKTYADKDLKISIDKVKKHLEKKMQQLELDAKPYLEIHKEAVSYMHKIEELKQYLLQYLDIYEKIKLKEDEIEEKNLRNFILLILLANEEKPSITEENFFETTEIFFKKLIESTDPALKSIFFDNKYTITYYNILDDFLAHVE